MMSDRTLSWLLAIVGGVVLGLTLVALAALLLWPAGPLRGMISAWRFGSNGEQIYFTGTSQRGTAITAVMQPGMGRMRGSRLTCASCHGADGRGGQVQMMMQVVEIPGIRHETLTGDDHGEDEHRHEPYTEQTIRRAITDGVDPDGEPLDWPMPRWSMADEDLDDLVEFLKTLD